MSLFHTYLFQSAIKSKGHRSLQEGEKVQFQILHTERGKIAALVRSPDGGNVRRKSRVKKGARKFTTLCYNCNENGHRMKKCPYERRNLRTCHKCGAKSHLIRTCPKLLEDNNSKIQQSIDTWPVIFLANSLHSGRQGSVYISGRSAKRIENTGFQYFQLWVCFLETRTSAWPCSYRVAQTAHIISADSIKISQKHSWFSLGYPNTERNKLCVKN